MSISTLLAAAILATFTTIQGNTVVPNLLNKEHLPDPTYVVPHTENRDHNVDSIVLVNEVKKTPLKIDEREVKTGEQDTLKETDTVKRTTPKDKEERFNDVKKTSENKKDAEGDLMEQISKSRHYLVAADMKKKKALEKLSEVFGIGLEGERGRPLNHDPPPKFMLNLYHTTADANGVSKAENPYNAKIVRSYLERGTWNMTQFLYFNVSGLEMGEEVLEAELRVHRPRVRREQLVQSVYSYFQVGVYQIQKGGVRRQIDLHRLDAQTGGLEVFRVGEAVQSWISGRAPNLGLELVASTIDGQPMDLQLDRTYQQTVARSL